MIDVAHLMAAARAARAHAYAPYSGFAVGAALQFADGMIITASNVENASYGLSLCAEALALARAMADGRRSGLVAIAVAGPEAVQVTPCGRCRQMLHELAALGGTDPLVLSAGPEGIAQVLLSQLLPHPFGPETIGQQVSP